MKRQLITVPGRQPSPILNPAVRVGDLVWTAGHTGRDPKAGQMPDDLETQTRNTLDAIQAPHRRYTREAMGQQVDREKRNQNE